MPKNRHRAGMFIKGINKGKGKTLSVFKFIDEYIEVNNYETRMSENFIEILKFLVLQIIETGFYFFGKVFYWAKRIAFVKNNNQQVINKPSQSMVERFGILLFLLKPEKKEEFKAYIYDYRTEMKYSGFPEWQINLVTIFNILKIFGSDLFLRILGCFKFFEIFNTE